ncbi:MAG: phosphotransferase, partial [Gammaproteobacteria bacterium]
HQRYDVIDPLATQVLTLASDIAKLSDHPDRIVHGDPKISNIIFDPETDAAICLIDLDTLGRMPIALELGDAFRSWCNPKPEDEQGAEFSLPLFEAAIAGYARETSDFLTETEWRAIASATYTITVELAARFCADALNESYFGWDDARFASASEHNEARTRGQIDLARSIASCHAELDRIVAQAFDPG